MKDYKKILEGVMNIINTTEKSDIGFVNICAYIGENCPELKESEDERIRQRIIHALHGDVLEMSEIKEAIDWLEKQGEQISANSAKTCKDEQKPKFRIGDTIKKESTGDIVTISEIDLQNREYRLSNTGFIPFKYENLWELVEQKPADKVEPKDYRSVDPHFFKPADKVEPKFNLYDWVVTDKGDTVQIRAVNNGYYTLYNGMIFKMSYVDKYWHRWTIADAKDGDVLCSGQIIVIFKHFEDPSYRQHIVAYIGLDTSGNVQITDGTWNLGIDKAKPATKEQRDLLFQKMEETGYKWDSEKKELKLLITNGGDFLESENCEQKPAWSEEDERNASYICAALDCYYRLREDRNNTNGQEDLDKARNWLYNKLKSLNPHNRWEPSDEQMDALDFAADCIVPAEFCVKRKVLKELLEQLKKLREE